VVLLLFGLALPGAAEDEEFTFTAVQASRLAQLPLESLQREFPNKLEHVMSGPEEVLSPKELHPVFYGSYDWHSSVHGHWMLVRILKLFGDLREAQQIRAILDDHFTPEKVAAEVAYLHQENRKSFERPYGWGWLLKLAEELHSWDDPDARRWSKNLQPLADAIADRYVNYFPKQTYPIRSGVHSNSALGLTFALDYAREMGDEKLESMVVERSLSYYGKDRNFPAAWEPGGDHFLSPALTEADLMRRILNQRDYAEWLHHFLPDLIEGRPYALLVPAQVTDRSDPKIVHLDGLNLSRAWAMRGIVASLPEDDPARPFLLESAAKHTEASLPHVTSGDYAGEHWLASFAVYLLSTTP
jgi:hypothetical protein